VYVRAKVRKRGGSGVRQVVEDLDQTALLRHEHTTVRRELHVRGVVQADEHHFIPESSRQGRDSVNGNRE
jgi:hypothetical protein